MSNRLRYLLILTIVVVVASLSSWLLRSVEERFVKGPEVVSRSPDYFMENFTATALNTGGEADYTLQASYLAHYPHNDSVLMRKPFMAVFRDDLTPWSMRADEGLVTEHGRFVELGGAVTLQRGKTARHPLLTLNTRDLRIDTRLKTAETEAEVEITQPGTRIRARGMRIDIASGSLELLANAEARYDVR